MFTLLFEIPGEQVAGVVRARGLPRASCSAYGQRSKRRGPRQWQRRRLQAASRSGAAAGRKRFARPRVHKQSGFAAPLPVP